VPSFQNNVFFFVYLENDASGKETSVVVCNVLKEPLLYFSNNNNNGSSNDYHYYYNDDDHNHYCCPNYYP